MAYKTYVHPTDTTRQLEVHDWSIKTYRRVGSTQRRVKADGSIVASQTGDQSRFAMDPAGITAASVEYDRLNAEAVKGGWVEMVATTGRGTRSATVPAGTARIPNVRSADVKTTDVKTKAS